MPTKHPSLEELGDPVFVTDEDLDDLSSFLGVTKGSCLERLRAYSPIELAQAWRQAAPKTPGEILNFYRSADLYIWDLMKWHASLARRPYWEALARMVKHYPAGEGWKRVYDFGAGVGTDALFLVMQGYDVTLVDVDGPAFRFARHRFERRGLPARFVTAHSMLPQPDGAYDVAICFDVFEHLHDPLEGARRLIEALRPGGLLLQCGSFIDEGQHPCHLADGIRRFGGGRWHIHLAGLGLRHDASLIYRKVAGPQLVVQRFRYWFWRITGFWVVRPVG